MLSSARMCAYPAVQMYTIVRDLLDNCIKETPDVWDWATELAIVGGGNASLQPPCEIVHRCARLPATYHIHALAPCVRRHDQPQNRRRLLPATEL